MKKSTFFTVPCWAIAICFLWTTAMASQATSPIRKGAPFPDVEMPAPASPELRAYLGIESDNRFSVRDIDADMVLVEIMNINCSSCQRQAPVYNELFSLIESTPETRGRIKMVAIAAGNMAKHVKMYTDHFSVQYPVVEDPDLEIYEALGRGATPHAVYVRKTKEDGKTVVADTHLGFEGDHKQIFDRLRGLMGMDLAEIGKEETPAGEAIRQAGESISGELVLKLIISALLELGYPFESIQNESLKDAGEIHVIRKHAGSRKGDLFARVVNRPPPCDQCHDIRYIYLFRPNGEILELLPIQLTKYGNEPWSEKDLESMRTRLNGRNLKENFGFDPEVDAVSSATITSLIIYNTLDKGKHLHAALLENGLIGKNDSDP